MTNTVELRLAVLTRATEFILNNSKRLDLVCGISDDALDDIGWYLEKYFNADKDWLRSFGFKFDRCYYHFPTVRIYNDKAGIEINPVRVYSWLYDALH